MSCGIAIFEHRKASVRIRTNPILYLCPGTDSPSFGHDDPDKNIIPRPKVPEADSGSCVFL